MLVPLTMYGAEVWHPVLEYEVHKKKLRRVQRRFLISATRAYRTTSYDSLYQLTDTIALDLEATYRLLCHRKRLEENRALFEEEKKKYRAILKEEHHKTFGKKLKVEIDGELSWSVAACPEVVYVATGHGPFGRHLSRIGVEKNSETCRLCLESDEEVQHYQRGCPALDYKINTKLNDKDEAEEFKSSCIDLIGRD